MNKTKLILMGLPIISGLVIASTLLINQQIERSSLSTAVEQYSSALFNGQASEVQDMQSQFCRSYDTDVINDIVRSAASAWPSAEIKNKQLHISGNQALVIAQYDNFPNANPSQGIHWIKENGKWKQNNCAIAK